jgi:hypothetical protein
MDKFQEAIRQVVENLDSKNYPGGMTSAEVLAELHKRSAELGLDLTLTTTLDVRDELEAIYR